PASMASVQIGRRLRLSFFLISFMERNPNTGIPFSAFFNSVSRDSGNMRLRHHLIQGRLSLRFGLAFLADGPRFDLPAPPCFLRDTVAATASVSSPAPCKAKESASSPCDDSPFV